MPKPTLYPFPSRLSIRIHANTRTQNQHTAPQPLSLSCQSRLLYHRVGNYAEWMEYMPRMEAFAYGQIWIISTQDCRFVLEHVHFRVVFIR